MLGQIPGTKHEETAAALLCLLEVLDTKHEVEAAGKLMASALIGIHNLFREVKEPGWIVSSDASPRQKCVR